MNLYGFSVFCIPNCIPNCIRNAVFCTKLKLFSAQQDCVLSGLDKAKGQAQKGAILGRLGRGCKRLCGLVQAFQNRPNSVPLLGLANVCSTAPRVFLGVPLRLWGDSCTLVE